MCLVASFLTISRVAWKPFRPGHHHVHQHQIRHLGLGLGDAFLAARGGEHLEAFLRQELANHCRSVGESSTTRIFFTAIAISSSRSSGKPGCGHERASRLACWRAARSRLSFENGLVRYSADPRMLPRARSNRPSFDDSMMTGTSGVLGIALEHHAGLIPVQPRHHDVAEDQVRLAVDDLGQRVESVLCQDDVAAGLLQKYLGAASDRVGVVDHEHLQSRSARLRPNSCLLAHREYPHLFGIGSTTPAHS